MKFQRRIGNEQAAAVLAVLSGEKTTAEVAGELDVAEDEVLRWRDLYVAGARGHMRATRPTFLSMVKRAPVRSAGIAIAAACVLLFTAEVVSQGPACITNGTLCIFQANTPARALDVNHNFSKLQEWMEEKVGPVTEPDVVSAGGTIRNATANGVVAVSNDKVFRDDESDNFLRLYESATSSTYADLAVGTLWADPGQPVYQLSGCYTRWGRTGCRSGWDEVVTGRSGGFESFYNAGGVFFGNVECVSNAASSLANHSGPTYFTRMMRGDVNGDGMDAVANNCSICCRGGCYTAFGTTTCASGYSASYTGRVGGIEAHSSNKPHGQTLCVDTSAGSRYNWPSGYATRLMRHFNSSGGTTNGMETVTNSCAVCCR